MYTTSSLLDISFFFPQSPFLFHYFLLCIALAFAQPLIPENAVVIWLTVYHQGGRGHRVKHIAIFKKDVAFGLMIEVRSGAKKDNERGLRCCVWADHCASAVAQESTPGRNFRTDDEVGGVGLFVTISI